MRCAHYKKKMHLALYVFPLNYNSFICPCAVDINDLTLHVYVLVFFKYMCQPKTYAKTITRMKPTFGVRINAFVSDAKTQ